MSLLANQSYANPSTPLWLSNAGGVITGNLTIDGNITTGTGVATYDGGGLGGLQILNSVGQQVTRIQHLPGVSPRTIIQSSDPIFFNQIGTAQGNTSLTVSAFGANADLLTLGGKLQFTSPNIIGVDKIPVGATNVTVPSTQVTASSFIMFTRPFAPAAGPGNGAAQGGLCYNPANIVPGVSFQVDLVDPATGIVVAASTVDAEFAYLIVN